MPTPPRPSSSVVGFVGRVEEAERLSATLLTRAPDRAHAPAAIVLGEPGIGKSTLLRVVTERVKHAAAHVVLRATGDPAEADLDFGLVEQLLRSAPGFSDIDLETVRGGGPLELGALLLRSMDAVEDDTRVLIVVDDAQWGDTPSLQALTFVARRLSADRAALLIGTRPEGMRALPPVLRELAEHDDAIVQLAGFTVDDVGELASLVRDRPLDARAVRRLHERTDGHPLHTWILLNRDDGDDFDAPIAPSVTRLLVDRLVHCSSAARAIVQSLAVLQSPAPATVVAALADVTDPLDALAELAGAGLIEFEDDDAPSRRQSVMLNTVALRHRLIREAVYADISPRDRLAMHARAAELVSGTTSLLHRVAAATGPDSELADALIDQASADAEHGAVRIAAERLYTAASLAQPEARAGLLLRAADHIVGLGGLSPARLSEVKTLERSALRSSILGRASMAAGHFGDAKLLLEEAWMLVRSEPDGHTSSVAATIAESLAIISLSSLDADAVVRWGERVATTHTGLLSTSMVCHGLAMRGSFGEARRRADQAVRDPEATAYQLADARLARGIVGAWSNHLDEAIVDLSAVTGGVLKRSLLQTLTGRAHLADVHLRAGRLTEASDMADEAVRLLEDVQADWLTPLPHSVAAYVHTAIGDLARATQHATTASKFARLTGEAPAMIWADAAWLRLAAARGNHAEVVRIGDRMLDAGLDVVAEGVNHWRSLYAESLAAAQRHDDAERILAQLHSQPSAMSDTSIATEVARAQTILATRRTRRTEALEAIEEGLSLDALDARPLPRARLELTAGAYLRRIGRRGAAGELLRTAAKRALDAGARALAEECARELAACGLSPIQRDSSTAAHTLTPQERMVARLVAEGRSNRQVAEELYVSVKTVEHHLSRVYSKLGVRNRTQMVHALPAELR